MARHNRKGHGTDQHGSGYAVSYPPDWLEQIKVTRKLESGRQSTKTLFRNPERTGRRPGAKVRTRIESRDENLDFEIEVSDPGAAIRRIIVETARPDGSRIQFTIDDRMVRRRPRKPTAGPRP